MDWVTAVSNVGFPIVVALFVLIKLNGKLEELATKTTELSRSMEELSDLLVEVLKSWRSKSQD